MARTIRCHANSSGDEEEEIPEEKMIWELDLDPASIRSRLWNATPFRLPAEERRILLRESPLPKRGIDPASSVQTHDITKRK